MALVQRRAAAADTSIRLPSRLGVLTLLLLAAVQFLDIVDASIVNVALPSIQRSLGFSQQNLQWDLLAAHVIRVDALDAGYHRGLLIGSISMLGAALIAMRIGNTREAGPLVLAPSDAGSGPTAL